jgi:hypothetical protein
MLAGDLVFFIGQMQAAVTGAITISANGGQTWTGPSEQAANDQVCSVFWCTFNGTWGADPSLAFAAQTGTQAATTVMYVFRPPSTSYEWAVDVAFAGASFAAPTTPFTVTITGQTTIAGPTLTFAVWCSSDDNSWTTVTGARWVDLYYKTAGLFPFQCRNLAGTDQSMAAAYFASALSNTATGNVSKNQTVVTGDAGVTAIMTMRAQPNIMSQAIM